MLMPSIFGENLFDDFFDDFRYPRQPAHAVKAPEVSIMKTDIKENEKGYDLAIELPGYKKDDMKLELKDGYLTISAEINQDNDEKDEAGNYIRRERYYGKSSRSFYVGEALTEEDIKAKYEDGILKINVPKKEVKPVVDEAKYISIEG
ncbi:MAG: Hsp20/alpha crystallin family protein [Lachnospiraceae bacterium]|nr:Hsp20/alpha crystallin family protein [Lachnospiraceae bacterium]